MIKVVGVKFPHALKIYDFLPGKHKVSIRDKVVVETAQGVEIGEVVYVGKESKEPESALEPVVRIAKEEDILKSKELEDKAQELMPLFSEKISKYELAMNPVAVCYSLDESRAIFYFTSDGRVDFRELAKELSRSLQKQAIMRQIGPRDEAKLVGGYGRCGREICCVSYLVGIDNISMETVEAQFGGPKNINKITGICGRLMCCLNYEKGDNILSNKGKKSK